MRRACVFAMLVACGASPGQRPLFTPLAKRVATASTSWIQFEPQATYFCARLPDGQIRALAYGVGTGFVLQEGRELLPAQRDAICGPRGLLVLGARGELAYGSNDGHFKMSYQMLGVEPAARSIGWLEAPCFVDDAGKVTCYAEPRTTAGLLTPLVNAEGPVKELLRGVPCVLMRDARVLCARINGEPGWIPMWTDVKQASVYALGWSQYGGCAVLRSGKVSCLGPSWLGQRGFLAKVDAHVATEVPGLDDIDEVTASSANACARRGGEVVCWGSAGRRTCGDEAFDASKPIGACKIDQAATDAARKRFEEAQRTCSDPKRERGHDDPFCRSMWRASPPETVFAGGMEGCDPSGHEYYRWAAPTRVGGIDDAVAIGTNGGLSCAMHATGALTCWGSDQRGTRTLAFPPRTPAPPPPPAITVAPRALALSVGDDRVVVTSASGEHVVRTLGKTIGPAVPLDRDVVDAIATFRVCALHEDGHVACEAPRPNTNPMDPGFPTDPSAVRMSMITGQGCVLTRDGILRGGTTPASSYASTQEAALLSAAGPIVEASGSCALGTDRAVRCLLKRGDPPRVVWPHADQIAIEGSFGCAVVDGAVSCTGMNYTFQRGDEEQSRELLGEKLTTIAGLSSIARVTVSITHACALDKDGGVFCWGRATDGETGPAAFAATTVEHDGTRRLARPMRVDGVAHAVAIGASQGHTCALIEGGELACWGRSMTGVERASTK